MDTKATSIGRERASGSKERTPDLAKGYSRLSTSLSALRVGASLTSLALAGMVALPAHAQVVITDDTPVDNPGGQTVTSADGVTQTVNSGDNIELENNTNDDTVITLAGTHINNDGDDEDVVIFVDNSEDDVIINITSTGVLQGLDGVIFYEGDAGVITNDGRIEGTGEATEAVVYFDRDADGELNTLINNGTITSVGGATIGVDALLGTDPSSGTVGDEEGIARFRLVNTGTISNTGTDSDADAIHFNGDPGTTGGEARGCREDGRVNCVVEVDITNSGTISASNDSTSNAAIRSESDAVLRGTIVNEAGGMITAATNAIRINGAHADHDVTITNAGTINGQAEAGILIGGSGVSVVNQEGGMIIGDDEGIRLDGDTISVVLFNGIDISEDTTPTDTVITNSGTIQGGGDGILVNSDAIGAIITNNATGTIAGNDGIQSATGGTVVNNGTITGADGDGIRLSGTQDASVTLGATSTTGGTSQAVQFEGTGTNTLNVVAGATVNGDLQGSEDAGATNILNLSGAASEFSVLNVLNFAQVTATGGVFELADGSANIGAIAINGGTVLVNLGATGAIAVNNGGTLGGTGTGGATAVADGGTINPGDAGEVGELTLGELALSSGSILAFDLGTPGVDSASDRITVAGDLTLDGILNVSNAGEFGLGVYSLITYGGSLTDNGLEVGSLPDGFEVAQGEVQTSVAGQINFVVSALTNVSEDQILFFDGADIEADGVIDGGAGVWDNATSNFTNAAGDENSLWNGSFAVFGGEAGGVVTVEDVVETIGLQFLVNGYSIEGGEGGENGAAIDLVDDVNNVRVGDDISATISAIITGDGALQKVEGGTLILSGANTFTGGAVVAGGTLQLDGSVLSETTVNAGATLAGTGTAAAVTAASGATIAPGTDGTVGTLSTGDLTLAENTILAFDLGAPDSETGSDLIQVNGDLTLDGLLNASDAGGFGIGVYRLINYTGTLTDNGLLVNALPDGFSLEQGSIQVSESGQVNLIIDRAIPSIQFWDGADAEGDNTIDGGSGSWNLTDTNWTDATGEFNADWNENFAVFGGAVAGTVTVDDAIAFSGLQFVTDGYTLAAGTGGLTISQSATAVRVDPGVTATIAAAISGAGGLNKLDEGTLTLEGANTYTGETVIDGGLLIVNGSVASSVIVNAGGSLGGTGTIGGLAVSGTLAPGNSIGTINVGGNLAFEAGSVLEIEVTPGGLSDLVEATGDVTINGGTVSILASSTLFNFSTDYTIVTAGGELDGQFDEVVTDLAFLTPILDYTDNAVLLTLRRNDVDFAAIGQTANQIATGAAVESAVNGELGNAIINLDAVTARGAFDQLSGELHPSARTAMVEENRMVRNAVLDQLTHQPGGSIWGEAWAYSGDTDGDGNAAGLDRDGFGMVLGADVALGDTASIGVAVNYSETDFNLDGAGFGTGTVDSFGALAYFGVDLGGVRVRTGGGFSESSVETLRSVAFATFTDGLSASYDGSVLFGFLEAGVPLEMGSSKIEPYVGLSFVEAETEGFTEAGGAAALRFEDEIENASNATAGVRFATSDEGRFQLRGNAGYQQGLGELSSFASARFVVGDAFTIAGASQNRSAAFAQVEASVSLSENSSIGVSYDGILGDAAQDHAGMVRLTIGF
ncbi:MAG: autotransporter domain-containing protein [Pseudomonadota bacterium]